MVLRRVRQMPCSHITASASVPSARHLSNWSAWHAPVAPALGLALIHAQIGAAHSALGRTLVSTVGVSEHCKRPSLPGLQVVIGPQVPPSPHSSKPSLTPRTASI